MIGLLAAIFELIVRFFKWKEVEDHRVEGREQQVVKQNEQVKEDVKVAEDVRKKVDADLAAKPDSLRDHDEFERP